MSLPLGTYHSNGKLLLSGEYFVLYGAKALALPLVYGQSLKVEPGQHGRLQWESYKGETLWFSATFDNRMNIVGTSDGKRAETMHRILMAALKLASVNVTELMGLRLRHLLQFNPEWGWGSSSTLIHNLSQWLGIDPFALSAATLGGSHYDIACASASSPIYYRLEKGVPNYCPAPFSPPFAEHLYFGFLGQKQDSRQAVAKADKRGVPSPMLIEHISKLSEQMAGCDNLQLFQQLMVEHEALVADFIGMAPVQKSLFSDFDGNVKSLGAWGGDFVLAASNMDAKETLQYFSTKGVTPLFKFHQIVMNKA
jgi:mevalonate kinase